MCDILLKKLLKTVKNLKLHSDLEIMLYGLEFLPYFATSFSSFYKNVDLKSILIQIYWDSCLCNHVNIPKYYK